MIEISIEKKKSAKFYKLNSDVKPAGLAPQAQYVFYAMAMIGEFATVDEIGAKCEEIAGFKTKQESSRIVQYYIPTLNKFGIVDKK